MLENFVIHLNCRCAKDSYAQVHVFHDVLDNVVVECVQTRVIVRVYKSTLLHEIKFFLPELFIIDRFWASMKFWVMSPWNSHSFLICREFWYHDYAHQGHSKTCAASDGDADEEHDPVRIWSISELKHFIRPIFSSFFLPIGAMKPSADRVPSPPFWNVLFVLHIFYRNKTILFVFHLVSYLDWYWFLIDFSKKRLAQYTSKFIYSLSLTRSI